MSEVIYQNKSGLILFENNVVTTLKKWRQHGRKSEAGGILIGYRRPPHIQVVACTIPYRKDKRTRFEFIRRDPKHIAIARQHWRNSNGQAYYLGDWHTHPVKKPSPSFVDKYEWGKLNKSHIGPNLLFVIVGFNQWCVHYNGKSLDLL